MDRRFLFVLSFAFCVPGMVRAQSAPSAWSDATGVVTSGTLDSAVGDYGFMTRSKVGDTIFAACKMDDLCDISFKADSDKWIKAVSRVRKAGPFSKPGDILDFVYSHYHGWSTRGLVAVQDMVEHLYSPRLSILATAANAKAEKDQEESPAVAPWMDDQEWKLAGYQIDITDQGPSTARGTVTFTNLDLPTAKPQMFTFDLVNGGSGWLIDDVITQDGPSGKGSRLSDYLKKYVLLEHGISAQKARTVLADASAGDRLRTSLDRASLCSTDEIAIFSCTVRKRTASLCASVDLGPAKGTMTYRFGKPGAIELAYPEPSVAPSKAFTAAVVERGDYVRFVRNGTSYKLYSLVPQGKNPFGGIMISENGRKVADLRCDGEADGLGEDNWAVMYKAKLPEDLDRSLDP